jgi:hypothetical protein
MIAIITANKTSKPVVPEENDPEAGSGSITEDTAIEIKPGRLYKTPTMIMRMTKKPRLPFNVFQPKDMGSLGSNTFSLTDGTTDSTYLTFF